jgi:hypothetical protein
VRLARQLSSNGIAIVTPDIPELSRFEITPAITDTIERAATWLAMESGLAPDHVVGMMGISFSGGLSIVAAGRPSLANRAAYVFAFGGHDDLPRVLRYLCTGTEPYPPQQVPLKPQAARARLLLTSSANTSAVETTDADPRVRLKPDATRPREGPPPTGVAASRTKADRGVRLQPDQPFIRPPHDYGVTVILLGTADRMVPPAQVEPLRAAIRRFLLASALDNNVDKERAAREFEGLRQLAATMPEPSATLLRYVNDRDVAHLGTRLLPYVTLYGGDPSLSVSKSPKPSVPIFLLHGVDDNVIPSIESEYLALDLRGHAPVRLLLSGLISHAEADRPVHIGDVLELAGFWGDLLSR